MGVIVVGVDGSEGAVKALRYALREARAKGSKVRAVSAWHLPATAYAGGYAPPFQPESFSAAARIALESALRSTAEEAEGVEVEQVMRAGQAVHVLLEEARGADLLVVGSRGLGGFRGMMLGSVSQGCAQHAPCPLLIVPGDDA